MKAFAIRPVALAVILMATAAREPAAAQDSAPPQPNTSAASSTYDPAIFQKPIPASQLAFLDRFSGSPAGDLARDKEFRNLMRIAVPDCTFHYGRDMPLYDALEMVLTGSPAPVRIREGRYVAVYGRRGPYLAGRGFLWFDMQEGIALGAFYFHPTNGEPTPTLTVFSRQVKEKSLGMSRLPPEFAADLSQWLSESALPRVTTRYFIGGSNKRILLEHDEDYCAPADGAPAPSDDACQEMDAQAADTDLTAAYYLQQVHYASNATAWMITGGEQVEWIRFRDSTCRTGPDPLVCRIRMTRERTHLILNRSRIPERQRVRY